MPYILTFALVNSENIHMQMHTHTFLMNEPLLAYIGGGVRDTVKRCINQSILGLSKN